MTKSHVSITRKMAKCTGACTLVGLSKKNVCINSSNQICHYQHVKSPADCTYMYMLCTLLFRFVSYMQVTRTSLLQTACFSSHMYNNYKALTVYNHFFFNLLLFFLLRYLMSTGGDGTVCFWKWDLATLTFEWVYQTPLDELFCLQSGNMPNNTW